MEIEDYFEFVDNSFFSENVDNLEYQISNSDVLSE